MHYKVKFWEVREIQESDFFTLGIPLGNAISKGEGGVSTGIYE